MDSATTPPLVIFCDTGSLQKIQGFREVTYAERFRSFGLFSCRGAMFAQNDRGTITGTVSDQAGGVVAAANVTARNVDTGAEFKTVTTGTGNSTIPSLVVGKYSLSVRSPGLPQIPAGEYPGSGRDHRPHRCEPAGGRYVRHGYDYRGRLPRSRRRPRSRAQLSREPLSTNCRSTSAVAAEAPAISAVHICLTFSRPGWRITHLVREIPPT